ncbi:type II secretion system F family protein [Tatumella sp. JGM100]|nr:type II secretion system F family protein [Tatumella sp. JGM16]MBS0901892.1 type II secretion system F family protein [Tatumella sp. JGM100]
MNLLFMLLLIMAGLCLLIVLQRNQFTRKSLSYSGQRKQMLLSIISQKTARVSEETPIISRLKTGITDKLSAIFRLFYAGSTGALIKNLTIPLLIAMAILALNALYIGLPLSWVAAASLVACYLVFYKIIKKRHYQQFSLDFSEALTTIGGAITSGRTFLQAMSDYSQSRNNGLSREFSVISRRLNFGEQAEVVFMESWRNYPYREYYFFIVAILLNINSGGRLREVLGKLQRSISNGIAMEKKMLSMTSEMRMSSKITGAIPFVFLILLKFISPENFQFVLEDQQGRVLLYYLIGSEVTGLLVIKFLMRKL